MPEEPTPFPHAIQARVDACYDHASNLLKSAARLLAADPEPQPHIAYHLAALALEETGKASLIVMGHLATMRDGVESAWIAKHAASHVKKLFHALWGPALGSEAPSGNQLRQHQDLAAAIHETRLQGLYISTSSEAALPHETVGVAETRSLLSLAEATLELARASRLHAFTLEEESDLLWFFDAGDDPEKRRLIFGAKSFEKRKELKDGRAWMRWLREQFEEAEARGRKRAEEELGRPQAKGPDALVQRWRVRVRFASGSHTIRPKALQAWNTVADWIKLVYINKNDSLGVDIVLPKAVPLARVYNTGLDVANKLLIALNVGTRGFFWWNLPEHVDRYYESIQDLEAQAQVVAERRPALKIDWQGGPLDEKTLREVVFCFAMLPSGPEKAAYEPYMSYLNGLAILAKSDIHFHAEGSAYQQFFNALREAFRLAGALEATSSFVEACQKQFAGVVDNDADWERLVSLGESIEKGPPLPTNITLEDVAVIKLLCEAFFLKTFRVAAATRLKQEENEGPSDTAVEPGSERSDHHDQAE